MADDETIFTIRGPEPLLTAGRNETFYSADNQPVVDEDAASQHTSSVYGDHGTPAPNWDPPLILRITTVFQPKNASLGFVIGRDEDNCDIVLNDARVSETHVCLKLNPTGGTILVKNLSKHGTRTKFSKDNAPMVLKGSTYTLMNFESVDIQLSRDLSIQIQRFGNPVNWAEYCADYAEEIGIPTLAQLRLSTMSETTNASNRAPVYVQDGRLGKGSFGEVFRVVERYTGNVYAMKLYSKPEKARWQEPATLQRLSHEHIVRYIGYSHLPAQPAQLIMEYVEGPNLQEFLDPGNFYAPLRMAEAQQALRQLLEAADYLHSMNVTHRDIKPSNIILVSRNPIHLKLVDFGFATDVSSFKSKCGTPTYIAPEMLTQGGRLSNKVDIFAIGVVAYSLFGIPIDPIYTTTPLGGLLAVLCQRQLLATSYQLLPVQFDLVSSLLEERPEKRPRARDCLALAFFRHDFDHYYAQIMFQPVQPVQPVQGLGMAHRTARIATEIPGTPAGVARANVPSRSPPQHHRNGRNLGLPGNSASQRGIGHPRAYAGLSSRQNNDPPTPVGGREAHGNSPEAGDSLDWDGFVNFNDGDDEEAEEEVGQGSEPNDAVDDTNDDDDNNGGDYNNGYVYGPVGVDRVQEPPGREAQTPRRAIGQRKKTGLQTKQLLVAEYEKNPRPSQADYARLIETVSMDDKQLRVWFRNRRHRDGRAAS